MSMKGLLFAGLIFIFQWNVKGQNCNCSENFDWMVKTFSENDAGFQFVLDRKGEKEYLNHTERLRLEASKARDCDECLNILKSWQQFFRKGHLFIDWTSPSNQKDVSLITDEEIRSWYANKPVFSMTEAQLKQKLSTNKSNDPLEGIWQMGVYKMGIIKDPATPEEFIGFIIKADSIYWMPGQIKARFKKQLNGTGYESDFALKDHSMIQGNAQFTSASKNLFNISGLNGFWQRVYPESGLSTSDSLLLAFNAARKVHLTALSDQTLYVRIPSFEPQYKNEIDSVLALFDDKIKSTPNLILDIRNGTGGSDISYENIIPYLYTQKIRSVGIQLLGTEANAGEREKAAAEVRELGYSENADFMLKQAKQMRENLNKFFNPFDDVVFTDSLEKVSQYPKKVGILINKANGSTDEQFLLAAKQSFKVKIFGKPTQGVLDISNMAFTVSPDGLFEMGYSMSKSYRLPDFPIDGIGIQPDFFLDDTIPEYKWIEYTQSVLEGGG